MVKMFKYALNLVFRRKIRTVLTSLGVLIAVMLMSFILFGMTDLERLIVNQFTLQFKPDELYIGNRDFFSGMGNVLSAPTKESEEKEMVILDDNKYEMVKDIDGVNDVFPLLLISNLDLYFENDTTKYPMAFPMASDIPGNHHLYKNHILGEKMILDDYEIFVSDFIPKFYEISNEEIIGKNIIETDPLKIDNIPQPIMRTQKKASIPQGELIDTAMNKSSDDLMAKLKNRGVDVKPFVKKPKKDNFEE